jgi:hypothetical protein
MKVLGKLFNRKKKLVNSPELRVCIIDDTTTDMFVTFGIIKERKNELFDACKEAYDKYDVKSEAYVYIVDKCKHVNEVVVCTIMFERMCTVNDDPLARLAKMFDK